ncbi:hypothetical protein DVH05_010254 [Phytophthora capsici]|nr:hypothetical protein DVH05_010254 [Phytophthora capsici]
MLSQDTIKNGFVKGGMIDGAEGNSGCAEICAESTTAEDILLMLQSLQLLDTQTGGVDAEYDFDHDTDEVLLGDATEWVV